MRLSGIGRLTGMRHFDRRSNALRPPPDVADAAGLLIMPGLVTMKCRASEIRHAVRRTVPQTRREFVWPARHYAWSLTGSQYPRMYERFPVGLSQHQHVSVGRSGDSARDEKWDHPGRQRPAWFISGKLIHGGTTRISRPSVSCRITEADATVPRSTEPGWRLKRRDRRDPSPATVQRHSSHSMRWGDWRTAA
jgi:hypothetical protein